MKKGKSHSLREKMSPASMLYKDLLLPNGNLMWSKRKPCLKYSGSVLLPTQFKIQQKVNQTMTRSHHQMPASLKASMSETWNHTLWSWWSTWICSKTCVHGFTGLSDRIQIMRRVTWAQAHLICVLHAEVTWLCQWQGGPSHQPAHVECSNLNTAAN